MTTKQCISPLATRPVLYTDTVGGVQTCRDDLWAVTTDELNAVAQPREQADELRTAANKWRRAVNYYGVDSDSTAEAWAELERIASPVAVPEAPASEQTHSLLKRAHRVLSCAAIVQIGDGEATWEAIGNYLTATPAATTASAPKGCKNCDGIGACPMCGNGATTASASTEHMACVRCHSTKREGWDVCGECGGKDFVTGAELVASFPKLGHSAPAPSRDGSDA